MSDLPSREAVGIDLALAAADLRHPDAPLFDILIIAAEWANGRLVDREALQPCHVRRTLHQTDYPCNRQQHYWLSDE